MGPGFDCIGMAVDIWSEITVETIEGPDAASAPAIWITAEGEGADKLGCVTEGNSTKNLIYDGLRTAFEAAGKPMPKLKVHCVNRIPYARGLGSSSAAIVGGLVAGLALAGHELSVWGDARAIGGMDHSQDGEQLLQLACLLEGHPDNVAPAIYGGIQLGMHSASTPAHCGDPEKGRWLSARVTKPDGLQCIIFIPDQTFETKAARALLPPKYTRAECVFNITRMALLMNALERSNLRDLKFGTQDCMHQPQRATVVKHLQPMIDAAVEAGAIACFLSGAGPTVMALTSGRAGDMFTQRSDERAERAVASAMRAAADAQGVTGRVYITRPSLQGVHIVKAEPPYSNTDGIQYPGGI
jgi:homoserine kinase